MATPGSGQTDWIMGVACNEVGEINYMFMRKCRLVCCCPNALVDLQCMHSDHIFLVLFTLFAANNNLRGNLPLEMKYLQGMEHLSLFNNQRKYQFAGVTVLRCCS